MNDDDVVVSGASGREAVEELRRSGALDALFERLDAGEVEMMGSRGLLPALLKEALERGQVRTQGFFNSTSMELTQKVMVNYTASILRRSLGMQTLGVPMQVDDLPAGWSLNRNGHVRYGVLEGPNGERLDFEAGPVRKLLTVCLCGCCPGRLV